MKGGRTGLALPLVLALLAWHGAAAGSLGRGMDGRLQANNDAASLSPADAGAGSAADPSSGSGGPGAVDGGALPTSAFGMTPVAMGPPKEDNDSDTSIVGTGKALLDPVATKNLPDAAVKDPCEPLTKCGECVADSRCGWCDGSQRCSSGGVDGPKDAVCEEASWNFMFCPAAQCGDYPTCTACIADSLCGWCVDKETSDSGAPQETCTEGDRRGPKRQGTCPSGYIHTLSVLGRHSAKQARTMYDHRDVLVDMCTMGGEMPVVKTPPEPARQPDAPVVVSASPTVGPQFGHTVVTITGAFFGSGADDNVTATVGGRPCLETRRKSTSLVVCLTPPAVEDVRPSELEDLPLRVTVNGLTSDPATTTLSYAGEAVHFGPRRFSYVETRVTEVTPARAPTQGGTIILINGANFGTRDFEPEAFLGGQKCLQTQWVSESQVKCVVPPGSGALLDVNVVIKGVDAANQPNQLFSYEAPALEAVRPMRGPTNGKMEVSLYGRNFGPAEGEVVANIGGVPCAKTTRLSHTLVKCVLPPGTGVDHRVGVTVQSVLPKVAHSLSDRYTAEDHVSFSYLPPRIHRVEPAHGPSKGRFVLRVFGTNFATGLPPADTNVNATDKGGALARINRLVDEGNYHTALKRFAKSWMWSVDTPQPPRRADGSAGEELGITGASSADQNGEVVGTERTTYCEHCREVECGEKDCASQCPILCTGSRRDEDEEDGAGLDEADAEAMSRLQRTGRNAVERLSQDDAEALGEGPASATARRLLSAVPDEATPQGESGARKEEDPNEAMFAGGEDPEAAKMREVVEDMESATGATGMDDDVRAALEAAEAQRQGATMAEPAEEAEPLLPCHPYAEDYTPFGLQCVKVLIGELPCLFTHVVSENELLCVVPPNTGSNKPVVVITDGQTSLKTDVTQFSYDPPVITKAFPTHGPATGEITMTVHGRNFGMKNFDPVVTVGGRRCMVTAWQADDAVECTLPYGLGANRSVVIEVGGQKSEEGAIQFSYDIPQVSGVHPNHGSTGGGFYMKIYGKNFGAEKHQPTAYVGEEECQETKWVSDSLVVCLVPRGHGIGLSVSVVAGDQRNEANALFTYDGPSVSRVEPNHCPARGGCKVTVHGDNFGNKAHASLKATLRGRVERPCADVEWISTKELTCVVPPGSGAGVDMQVQMGGASSPPNSLWFYDPPTIDSFDPKHAQPQGGEAVTVLGKNFGTEDSKPTVAIGDKKCASTVWVSDTELLCKVPEQIGWNLTVVAEVDGQRSEPASRFDYAPPVVIEVKPNHGPTEGKYKVEIRGMNFPPDAYSRLGALACEPFKRESYELLTCGVPEGVGANHSVEIFSGGRRYLQTRINGTAWIVSAAAPVPSRAKGPLGIGTEGDVVVGPNAAKKYAVNETAQALFPEEEEGDAGATGATGGGPGGDQSIEEADGVGLGEGTAFGDEDEDKPVASFVELFAAAGTTRTVRAAAGLQALAHAMVPHAIGDPGIAQFWELRNPNARKTFVAIRAPVYAKMNPRFSYDRPVLEALDPDHGVAAGGQEILVKGRNFGPWGSHPVVYIDTDIGSNNFGKHVHRGMTACQRTKRLSHNKLECMTPAGVSSVRTTIVSVGGQNSSHLNKEWDYDPPVVEQVEPNHGPPRGGYELKVWGVNFGTVKTNISVKIGGRECLDVQWKSDNLITCKAPPYWGLNRTVVVGSIGTDDPQQSERLPLFSYDPPKVFRIKPKEARIHGGAVVQVHGLNFGGKGNTMQPEASVGGVACLRTVRVAPNLINCTVPPGMGRNLDVRVRLGTEHNKPNELFSYTVMDCRVTRWVDWTECSHQCIGKGAWYGHDHVGPGTQQRHRSLIQPAENGGKPCGEVYEHRNCTDEYCPVHCKMSEWKWTQCTQQCNGRGAAFGHNHVGPGEKTRTRKVIRPPEYGGDTCPDFRKETVKCNEHPCPVDCVVGGWSGWSSCPRPNPRNPAYQKRTRGIVRHPAHGGRGCPALEQKKKCPIPPVKPRKCRSSGDPHTTTFDGAWHDFYHSGEFWWSRTPDGSFDVQTYLVTCGGSFNGGHRPTCIRGAAIRMDGQIIVTKGGRSYVNGRHFNGNRHFGSVHVHARGGYVKVTNARRETVRASGSTVIITASYSLARRSKGLCGNFNGNWRDDFKDNNGRQWNINSRRPTRLQYAPGRSGIQGWGNTYRVSPGDSLFRKGMARFAEVSVTLVEAETVAKNASSEGMSPEKACSGNGFDPALQDSCAGDITMTGDYSYVDEYKKAQEMSDAADEDMKALEEFDTAPTGNSTQVEEEDDTIETAPSQDAAHHVDDEPWYNSLLP